jgi:hypothetical protein
MVHQQRVDSRYDVVLARALEARLVDGQQPITTEPSDVSCENRDRHLRDGQRRRKSSGDLTVGRA